MMTVTMMMTIPVSRDSDDDDDNTCLQGAHPESINVDGSGEGDTALWGEDNIAKFRFQQFGPY